MPRIAASLAVVVIVGVCIGFNTARYPVVWTMVANAHRLPRLDQAPRPALAERKHVCTGNVCRLMPPDPPTDAVGALPRSVEPASPPAPPAVTVPPAAPAPPAVQAPREPKPDALALVPVSRPKTSGQSARRLPPLDRAVTLQASSQLSAGEADLPLYPATTSR